MLKNTVHIIHVIHRTHRIHRLIYIDIYISTYIHTEVYIYKWMSVLGIWVGSLIGDVWPSDISIQTQLWM